MRLTMRQLNRILRKVIVEAHGKGRQRVKDLLKKRQGYGYNGFDHHDIPELTEICKDMLASGECETIEQCFDVFGFPSGSDDYYDLFKQVLRKRV